MYLSSVMGIRIVWVGCKYTAGRRVQAKGGPACCSYLGLFFTITNKITKPENKDLLNVS